MPLDQAVRRKSSSPHHRVAFSSRSCRISFHVYLRHVRCPPLYRHVCYGFYSWEWVYTDDATDLVSGKSASGGDNFSSSNGAVEHATFNLFNILDMSSADAWDCNFAVQDSNVTDQCSLRIGVGFYFPDPGAGSLHGLFFLGGGSVFESAVDI